MLKNFKPISLILLAGATCFPASIFAETMPSKQGMNISQQNGKVTGTVVDDLGPVAGASVVVKGTTNGNITDMDGNFTLEGVKNGDIIQISFIGYTYNRQNEKYEFSKRKVQEETFEYSLNEVRTSLFHSVILYPFERSHIEFKQDIFTTFN